MEKWETKWDNLMEEWAVGGDRGTRQKRDSELVPSEDNKDIFDILDWFEVEISAAISSGEEEVLKKMFAELLGAQSKSVTFMKKLKSAEGSVDPFGGLGDRARLSYEISKKNKKWVNR